MNITLERPFAATEKGCKKNNEDCIYPQSELARSGERFFMVCDGVGGNRKGEVASALACEAFQTFFQTFFEGGDPTEDFINRAVHYAETRFDDYVRQHPEAFGMATTMTFLFVGLSGVTIAHIGDSRIYHFRQGKIIRCTEDHSLVNSWVKLGIIRPEEAATHPKRNVVTRAIMDSSNPVTADVEYIADVRAGDRFFLCTDGVTGCISDSELEGIFAEADGNAEVIKDILVERCTVEARDNFSFYILPVQGATKKTKTRNKTLFSLFYVFT